MYLLAKFDDHRSYRNVDINSYINSCIDTLEKTELTASICHIAKFLKSGIRIYNSEVPDTAGRKTRRKSQAIAKRYAFGANAMKSLERRPCLPLFSAFMNQQPNYVRSY